MPAALVEPTRDGRPGRGDRGSRDVRGRARPTAAGRRVGCRHGLLCRPRAWSAGRCPRHVLHPAAAYWLMAALAVVVDARPYWCRAAGPAAVILPSICFTFAIALAWGFGPALAVQLVAVAVAGVRMRHSVRRTLHSRCSTSRPWSRPRWSPRSASLRIGARPRLGRRALTCRRRGRLDRRPATRWPAWSAPLLTAERRPARRRARRPTAGHRRAAAARPGGAGRRPGRLGPAAAGAAGPARRAPDGPVGRRVRAGRPGRRADRPAQPPRPADRDGRAAPAGPADAPPCSCSTWTGSARSTTRSVTAPATGCWSGSPTG